MKLTKEYLEKVKPEDLAKTTFLEYYKCCTEPKYCIETYFTVMSGMKEIPFKLYPHQIDSLNCYEKFTNNILMKTRQMGLTTFSAAYVAWNIMSKNNFKVLLISKSMNDAQKFLADITRIIDRCQLHYPWLMPQYLEKNKRKIILKGTNSSVEAQATGEDAGRGLTPHLLIVDEVAFIDRRNPEKMSEIWSAAGVALTTVKGKAIMISTPMGTSGWYYDTYINAKEKGWHVIDAHWLQHPIFSAGAYQWIPDITKPEGGYLKFYNSNWPEEILDQKKNEYVKLDKASYPFNCDGKLRSPWYDLESVRLGPHRTKRELDCSFTGTGGEVFDADILREMKTYSDSIPFTNPYAHLKGLFKNYKEFKPYVEGHKYIIAADVATGDGSDFSTFVVFDLTTLEIVATFKDQLLPNAFAKVLDKIGRHFGLCHLIVENQGGGFTTLQTLKEMGYNNIYYSTLNRKDPSTGLKKRKIGLWASEDVRLQGGDKLEELIRERRVVIPCSTLVEEFYNWIWDKDGKRRHAPGKNDDLCMALQHACWYYQYVYKRSERQRDNFTKTFEVQRNGQSTRISDNNNAAGSMVKITQETVVRNTGKSGNIDSYIDDRMLTTSEIAIKPKRIFC